MLSALTVRQSLEVTTRFDQVPSPHVRPRAAACCF